MAAGERFSPQERADLARAVRESERLTGLTFEVEVGPVTGDSRAYATRVHAALPSPETSVFVQVDPVARTIEIVTGSHVRSRISDRQAALAVISMQSAFAAGSLSRGIQAGLQQLVSAGRVQETLHADTP